MRGALRHNVEGDHALDFDLDVERRSVSRGFPGERVTVTAGVKRISRKIIKNWEYAAGLDAGGVISLIKNIK